MDGGHHTDIKAYLNRVTGGDRHPNGAIAKVMAFYGDNLTFEIAELGMKHYPITVQIAPYASLLITFGVKLPIFPVHTWLPNTHSEASAPVSRISQASC